MSDINIKKVSYLAKLALNDDKAALYEKNFAEQYKKNNPYTVTTPDNKRSTTTN